MTKPISDVQFAVGLLRKALGGGGLLVMLSTAALVVLTGGLMSLPPLIIGKIVSSLSTLPDYGALLPYFGLILAIFFMKEVFNIGQKFLIEKTSVNMQRIHFDNLVTKLFNIEVSALQSKRIGEITSRIDRSSTGIGRMLKLLFMDFTPSIVSAAFAIALSIYQHWIAGLAMLAAAAINVMVTYVQLRTQKGIRINLQERRVGLAGKVGEMLANLAYVRAAWLSKQEGHRLREDAYQVATVEMTHHKAMMSFDAAKQLVDSLGLIAVVALGIVFPLDTPEQVGGILTLVLLYGRATQPIQVLHRVVDEGQEAVIAISAMRGVVELPDDVSLNGVREVVIKGTAVAEVSNLSVNYHSDEKQKYMALSSVSLSILRGDYVGLVGPTGCGKSTLVKVLLGLQPNFSGHVEVFGTNIHDLSKESLARSICYLPQDPYVVAGTLRQNLWLNSMIGSDDDLKSALKRACAPVEIWADGLDTEIHEGGKNLSGGLRQRLSLARAFLSAAEMLVLDEATSQLDSVTEEKVMSEISKKYSGKTIIAIAHRLTSLSDASRLVVMEGGAIVQEGSFQYLSGVDGIFAKLVQAYELTKDPRSSAKVAA